MDREGRDHNEKRSVETCGNVDSGNCCLYSRCFGGAGDEWTALHEANGGQLVAAAWVEPAERIEQCVMDFGEGDPTYTVTGYDAQNREIWSSTTFGKLASVAAAVMCTSAITSARYFFGQGGKADSVCQYDEQGRLIRMETDYGGISTYYYRGDATETYLEKRTTRRAR